MKLVIRTDVHTNDYVELDIKERHGYRFYIVPDDCYIDFDVDVKQKQVDDGWIELNRNNRLKIERI